MTKKETNESLEMVLRSVNRLARLINDILDISRIDSARMRFSMQDVDVKPFIDHTVKTMAPLADNSKVKIKTTFKGLPLKLQFDPDRIQQVLINLISNAIDHSETKKLSIGSIKKGDNIVFYVKDYGAGISTKELPHIFDKFYSGKERKMFHHGTGLGLAICNGIMDAHKGKIWVESNLKKGTTFFFSLPLNKKNYKDKK